MKKLLLLLCFLSVLFCTNRTVNSQGFNTVIEYCTGTWCQWCPCGHTNIANTLLNYPNTMVLAYHGPANSSDPWDDYSVGMISLFGFNAYPTGAVGRRTGVIGRDGWNNQVVIQSNQVQPGCTIQMNNKNYNSGTRTITGDVVLTSTLTQSGNFYVNFILTEDNVIYTQTGNASCPGSGAYTHMHIVKALINGATGQLLATTDTWTSGMAVTIPFSYVVPAGVVPENSKINILVYKSEGSISTNSHVQQTRMEGVTTLTGIHNNNEIPSGYSLSQNYPNPFNPTTSINFSIPKDGDTKFKIYDILGNEVMSYVDGFMKAGTYNVDVDASNLATGIYFYTLQTSDFVETKKMSLVK